MFFGEEPNYWMACYHCGSYGHAPYTCAYWQPQFNSFEEHNYINPYGGAAPSWPMEPTGFQQQPPLMQGEIDKLDQYMIALNSKIDRMQANMEESISSLGMTLREQLDQIDQKHSAAIRNLETRFHQLVQDMNDMNQDEFPCVLCDESDEEDEVIEISLGEHVEVQHDVLETPFSQELNEVTDLIDYAILPVDIVPQEPNVDNEELQITQESTSTPSVGEDNHSLIPPITTFESLECSNLDFLGVEVFLKKPQQKWVLYEATKIHLSITMLPTPQALTKDRFCFPKLSLHNPNTASKMALALLAIHGVLPHLLGDFFSLLLQLFLFWSCYIFFFVSYILFVLKWKNPP